jgi:hypothetical protein
LVLLVALIPSADYLAGRGKTVMILFRELIVERATALLVIALGAKDRRV